MLRRRRRSASRSDALRVDSSWSSPRAHSPSRARRRRARHRRACCRPSTVSATPRPHAPRRSTRRSSPLEPFLRTAHSASSASRRAPREHHDAPAHFKRVPAPSRCSRRRRDRGHLSHHVPAGRLLPQRAPHAAPRVFLSASISWEPSETVGDFLLSLSIIPVSFAIVARKLELDLRRAQLPRKEAPVGARPRRL